MPSHSNKHNDGIEWISHRLKISARLHQNNIGVLNPEGIARDKLPEIYRKAAKRLKGGAKS